ncbi:DUF4388 domain-containing protein [Desulfobacterales bacterium HSG16]|nr:DUF4388 domain-containing protein [Desulfobacterales bacterium HSG16]
MSESKLRGSLVFLGLGDVLQLIGSIGETGVLKLICPYTPQPGFVYFDKGKIANASSQTESGLKAIYSFFGWSESLFEFIPEDITCKKIINDNRMAIILDGLRMIDDGQTPKLGPAGQVKTDKSKDEEKKVEIPLITGDPVDYIYVVSEEEYDNGQACARENTYSTWMWNILEGVVDIIKETPHGPLRLGSLGEGSFIGSLNSFSFETGVRYTSAVAVDSILLGVMDLQRMGEEYNGLSSELRNLVFGLDKRLEQCSWYAVNIYTKDKFIKALTEGKQVISKPAKSPLLPLSVIKEGQALVITKTAAGQVPLALLEKGDYIGKIPFFKDMGQEPDAACVLATEDFVTEPADCQVLEEEYKNLSPVLKSLVDNIVLKVGAITRTAINIKKISK